ncbi:MAG: hypothetical protein IKM97_06040 [Clostridia bacterium]|nr:hypothetical protein [Clostridia bacterium]
MHECLLCKRDMKTSNDTFGNGCIRNIYSFLEMSMPKKVKLREDTLYKNIMKINRIRNINMNQKIWLTDRYLTYQYLDRLPYGDYSRLKKQINTEIQSINQIKNNEEPKSTKNMSLKQAYDLYKKATKFTEGINKLRQGNFTDEESIKLLISSFSFIFHMNKNKSQYENNSFRAMQNAFWQTVIEVGGKYVEFDISADFLQHSLEKEPNDLLIKNGKVVQEIVKDKNFQDNINNIIEKYGANRNEFIFDSTINSDFPMRFGESDLYYSLNNVSLYISGVKYGETWNLDIKIHDRYDYSKRKTLSEHYNDVNSVPKSIFSSTMYNLAHYSINFGVMKEYDIDIQFKINTTNFEVIE